MKLPGYCEKCHRVRSVTVKPHGMALGLSTTGIVFGVCDQCQDEEDARRRAQR